MKIISYPDHPEFGKVLLNDSQFIKEQENEILDLDKMNFVKLLPIVGESVNGEKLSQSKKQKHE